MLNTPRHWLFVFLTSSLLLFATSCQSPQTQGPAQTQLKAPEPAPKLHILPEKPGFGIQSLGLDPNPIPAVKVSSLPVCGLPKLNASSVSGGGTTVNDSFRYGVSTNGFSLAFGDITFSGVGAPSYEPNLAVHFGNATTADSYNLTVTPFRIANFVPYKDLKQSYSSPMRYVFGWGYGSHTYEGMATVQVDYTADTGLWVISVSGHAGMTSIVKEVYGFRSGSTSIGVTGRFQGPVCGSPAIDIQANPVSLQGSNGIVGKSSVGVSVSKATSPWVIRSLNPVSGPPAAEGELSPRYDCPQDVPDGPFTGNKTFEFPFNPATLANGEYKLLAYYNDFPQLSDNVAINVDIPSTVTPSTNSFRPLQGETVSFTVNGASCPGGVLTLKSTVTKADGTPGAACQTVFEGLNNGTQVWDGTCYVTAADGSVSSGKAIGSVTAEFIIGNTPASPATLTADHTPVQPTATPTPEPTSTPTPEPTPDPTATPSPSPTATPSACNPDGFSTQAVDACPTPNPSSSTTPVPTPNPSQTPIATPGPGCNGYDNGLGEKNGLQDQNCEERVIVVNPYITLADPDESELNISAENSAPIDDFRVQRVDTIKKGSTLSLGRNQIALLGANISADFPIKPGEKVKVAVSLGVRPVGSNNKVDDVVESPTEIIELTTTKPKKNISFKWFGRDTRIAEKYYKPFATAQWAYPSGTMITGPYFVTPGTYELKTYVIALSNATPIEKTYLNFKIENLRPDYMHHIPKTMSQIDKEHIIYGHHPFYLTSDQVKFFTSHMRGFAKKLVSIREQLAKSIANANQAQFNAAYHKASSDIQKAFDSYKSQITGTDPNAKGTCVGFGVDADEFISEVKSVANMEAYDVWDFKKKNVIPIQGRRSYNYEVLLDPNSNAIITGYPLDSNTNALSTLAIAHYYLHIVDSNYSLQPDFTQISDIDFILYRFNPNYSNLNYFIKSVP